MKRILLMVAISLFAQVGYPQHKDTAQQNNRDQTDKQVVYVASLVRTYDYAQITRGKKLFLQYCADCHGKNGEGAPNWRQRNADGKYPPPPLNGTGHAWHHPMKALRMTIRDGTQKIGGNMPAWGDKLTEQEIEDIIAWFQSEWPDELFQAWHRQNKKHVNK